MAGPSEDSDLQAALADLEPEQANEVRALLRNADRPVQPGDPRLHHYVPQFYLKRFADDEDRVGVIELAKPSRGHRRVNHVSKVAAIKDFYTIVHVDGHDTTVVENILGAVDGRAARVIPRIAYGVLAPSDQDRFDFSLWLAFQNVRGPRTRRQLEAMGETVAKLEISMNTCERSVREFLAKERGEEPNDDDVDEMLNRVRRGEGFEVVVPQNHAVSSMLQHGIDSGAFFFDRTWTLLRSDEPVFLTSDHPIALHQYAEHHHPFFGVGIATADEILVPLDRQTVPVAHHFDDFPTKVLRINVEEARELNRQILQFAYAEVYGHPDDVMQVESRDLPKANRPVARVDGGPTSSIILPDGLNAPPSRARPRRFRAARGA